MIPKFTNSAHGRCGSLEYWLLCAHARETCLLVATILRCTPGGGEWGKCLGGLGRCADAASVQNCLPLLFSTLAFLHCLNYKVKYYNYCNKELYFPYTDVNKITSIRN